MRNKRVVISRLGGPEVLQIQEENLPEPGLGEALDEVARAHELLGSGSVTGKIVLLCNT
ncbi:MAG TPA: hypothetical protein VFY54_23695 [Rubrobacter sp.]|nr:hypothetical protein [Rubrobacter sp.]